LSLLFNFQKEPGAGGDQVGASARRLTEKQHALVEQERIKKHGASIRVSGREAELPIKRARDLSPR